VRETIDVMIDLETLGTSPGSVVLAIAAATTSFDRDEQRMFAKRISVVSSLRAGLTVDQSTIGWWSTQPQAVWDAATDSSSPLELVLLSFAEFLGELRKGPDDQASGNKLRLWGDASSFDLVLLACAYRAVRLPVPWEYWDEFDYRTLRTLLDSEKPRSKVHHDALQDARAQLEHLQEMLNKLRSAGVADE
jgi:hypothetical protein